MKVIYLMNVDLDVNISECISPTSDDRRKQINEKFLVDVLN